MGYHFGSFTKNYAFHALITKKKDLKSWILIINQWWAYVTDDNNACILSQSLMQSNYRNYHAIHCIVLVLRSNQHIHGWIAIINQLSIDWMHAFWDAFLFCFFVYFVFFFKFSSIMFMQTLYNVSESSKYREIPTFEISDRRNMHAIYC